MRYVALVCAVGCTQWHTYSESDYPTQVISRAIVRRTDVLPGKVGLTGDGKLVVSVDATQLCTYAPPPMYQHVERQRNRISNAGWGVMIAGALVDLGAAIMFHQVPARDRPEVDLVSAVGAAIQLGPPLEALAEGKRRQVVVDVPEDQPAVECSLASLGDPHAALELTTPWGERLVAPLDDDDRAEFAVSWRAATPAQLAGEWTVRFADRSAPVARWTMTPEQRERAAGFTR
jgi:hypothetical protein